MPRIRLDQDLRSVTEFRARSAALIDQVRSTKRPLVLTQHGRGAAVVVDVEEYEKMVGMVEIAAAAGGVRQPNGGRSGGGAAVGAGELPGASAPAGAGGGVASDRRDPIEAYKDGVDRSLLRENIRRPVAERLRRLEDMARFAASLRAAGRRAAPR